MSSAVEFAKLAETQDYNNKQYQIQQAELLINRQSLYNEYQNQLLNYQSNILSAESQRDSYKESMEQTENVLLPQVEADISSYESLLGRWDSNFTATMTAAKQEGQSNYETLLGNFANMGVANAETGREGATANLLEQKQKQNVVDYVGSDMQLDQNGGLFGMAITEQALDLYADKASYETQLDILKQSQAMYEENLNGNYTYKTDDFGQQIYDANGDAVVEYENPDSYAANIANIDKSIANYKNQVAEYEKLLATLEDEWSIDKLSTITGEDGTTTSTDKTEETTDETTDVVQATTKLSNGVYQYKTSDGETKQVYVEDGKMYQAAGIKDMMSDSGIRWKKGEAIGESDISGISKFALVQDFTQKTDAKAQTQEIEDEEEEVQQTSSKSYKTGIYSNGESEYIVADDGTIYEATKVNGAWRPSRKLTNDEVSNLEMYPLGTNTDVVTTYDEDSLTPSGTYDAKSWDEAPTGLYQTSDGKYVYIENGKMYTASYVKSGNKFSQVSKSSRIINSTAATYAKGGLTQVY